MRDRASSGRAGAPGFAAQALRPSRAPSSALYAFPRLLRRYAPGHGRALGPSACPGCSGLCRCAPSPSPSGARSAALALRPLAPIVARHSGVGRLSPASSVPLAIARVSPAGSVMRLRSNDLVSFACRGPFAPGPPASAPVGPCALRALSCRLLRLLYRPLTGRALA